MTKAFITQLRVTVFSGQEDAWTGDMTLQDVLKAVSGRECEKKEEHPRTRLLQVQAYHRSSGWLHTVRRLPGRLDLFQDAVYPPDAATQRFRKIEPAPSVLDGFARRNAECESIWRNVEVVRVAIGTSIRWSRDNSPEVIEALRSSLPSLDVEPGDKDILFRRNRPVRVQGADGGEVEINRLETWKTEVCTTLDLPEGPLRDARYALVLDTDCNTDARRREPFRVGEAATLLEACRQATLELWSKGPQQ